MNMLFQSEECDVAMNGKCFKTGANTELKRPTSDNPNNDCFRACNCTTFGSPRGGFLNPKQKYQPGSIHHLSVNNERGDHFSTCREEMPW
jgi:hypothetical protein